jgi:hypothetical protein
MMKKSLICLLALFLLYNAALLIVDPPDRVTHAQHQWQMNVLKAQEYVYDRKDSRYVFAGTSLTFRLPGSALPDGSFNLAMAGTSTFEGLEIIKTSGASPEAVFIETNFLFRKPDNSLTGSLFQPVMYRLRKWLPALRERNQPVSYYLAVTIIFKRIIQKIGGIFTAPDIAKPLPPAKAEPAAKKRSLDRQAAIDRNLKVQLEALNTRPSDEEAGALIESLRAYVRYFQQKGVQVIFFEVPFHQKLYGTRYNKWKSGELERLFPPEQYAYIKYPFADTVKTTDGVHLTKESALLYCSYLSQQIEKIMNHRSS